METSTSNFVLPSCEPTTSPPFLFWHFEFDDVPAFPFVRDVIDLPVEGNFNRLSLPPNWLHPGTQELGGIHRNGWERFFVSPWLKKRMSQTLFSVFFFKGPVLADLKKSFGTGLGTTI